MRPSLPLPVWNLAALLAAAVLVPSRGSAGDFETLETRAETVPDLAAFLDAHVGRCPAGPAKAACEAAAARARKAAAGKLFAVRIPEAAGLVRLERRAGDAFLVLLTPFIDGGSGIGLSHGAPLRLDPDGNPVMPLVGIPGEIAPGQTDLDVASPFRRGQVELAVVFEVRAPWKLARKGAPGTEGLTARFRAVRVVDGRTGALIAEKEL
jgi:hypothetical protein